MKIYAIFAYILIHPDALVLPPQKVMRQTSHSGPLNMPGIGLLSNFYKASLEALEIAVVINPHAAGG